LRIQIYDLLSFWRHLKADLMIRLSSHRCLYSASRLSHHHICREYIIIALFTNGPLPAYLLIPRCGDCGFCISTWIFNTPLNITLP